MHRHGCYTRFVHPQGKETRRIQRYLCPRCGHTISIAPTDSLPYRPLEAHRLEAFLDQQVGLGCGPGPPLSLTEAGCLERAWSRFQKRSGSLQQAFGQLLPALLAGPADLWKEIRRSLATLSNILLWLAKTRNISLLGDYACLKPPTSD
jgi:hypothetical protein